MNLSEKLNFLMNKNNIRNPKDLALKLNAAKLGIPYTTLLTILNNEVQDIKLKTAYKLCTFFNITLDELLDDNIPIPEKNLISIDITGLSNADIQEIKNYVDYIKNRKNKGSK